MIESDQEQMDDEDGIEEDIILKLEELKNEKKQIISEDENKLKYVISQKGRTQLVHKGFYYVREKMVGNKVYWRCTQYTTAFKCHGRIHTNGGIIVHRIEHNHDQTDEKPDMRKHRIKGVARPRERKHYVSIDVITESM